ncbi:major facilitator superfamily domain-containing protein [Dactylonectria macrodidyma]|uniref:Major facilitator superfamily domain-containing protein n=1 Tax=Dactylonectria macrodidyma TaxID=307937 RepID=A0A9P9JCZ9_9HYPO|nr:major facilitator superfamily domain-containing protein [Dactylonectria macrodidyma]
MVEGESALVEEAAVLKRIDLFVLPLLFVTYILQFLDKTSLGNTAILGVIQDTKLVGQEFSWLNSAFYFGYLAASYPVSIILVKFPLGKTMSISIILWAIVLACHGATNNFVGLCIVRVLLGVFESTISPGFSLITGLWYKPSEHAARHGVWFLGNSVGGFCGALIAYGCSFITSGPLEAWRWLFVMLGIITALWGIVMLFALPDTPKTARFLKPEQRIIANQRPQENQRTFKTNKWSHTQFMEALKDPKTWFLFVIMTISCLTNGVISNFTSLIVAGLGYDVRTTLLLGLPTGVFQFVVIFISTFLADKFRRSRCNIIIGGYLIALLGVLLIRQLPTTMKAGRYVGVLLLVASTNIFPLMLSLIASNTAGFTKKATVNAVFFIGYCAGNIGGPQLFIAKEAPTYQTAFTALLVIYCLVIIFVALFRVYLNWENKRRDKDQGVFIDPEPRNNSPTVIHDNNTEEVDETDWENKRFRYYL